MAVQGSAHQFKTIQLLKDISLGSGSYGAVCKAKCDDLECAAKLLHFPDKVETFMKLFERDWRHPNLIQYLGTWRDPGTTLPVLLMELMDENLTQFLEKSNNPIPFHTQVNICHDVSLALSFLHSNGIIHRDLSSNNVLMLGDRRAKVTDFVMTKLWDANTQKPLSSLSKAPGCDVYMPPEAASGGYSEKFDCFSYGVLTIQVLTHQFPQPGNQFKVVYISDPNFPNGIETRASEAERRKTHIDLIASDQPLLQIALECIKDKPEDRPSSKDLCNELATLKEAAQYTESITKSSTDRLMEHIEKQVWDIQNLSLPSEEGDIAKDTNPGQAEASNISKEGSDPSAGDQAKQVEVLQSTIQTMQDKELAVSSELLQLKTELQGTVQQLREKEIKLQAHESQAFESEKKIEELEKSLVAKSHATHLVSEMDSMELVKVKLDWKKAFRAPCALSRTSEAMVTTEKVIYMRPAGTKELHGYDTSIGKWLQFPNVPVSECSLAIIKRRITTIGGQANDQFTNQLLSLVENNARKEWVKLYPSMATKRSNTVTIHCQNSLVVAGGEGDGGYLKTVEVLDTGTLSWSVAASLPQPLVFASATHTGNQLYLLGGWVEKMTPTYSTLTTSLQALLRSSQPSTDEESSTYPWQELASLPLKGSTCVAAKGRLLAVGGRDIHKPTTVVHIYNPLSNSWEVLAHLTHPRHQCFAAVLDRKLVVLGGWKLGDKQILSETNTVETAIVG